ncbi:zinc finger and BTB domain-containing protein 14-like [Neocloeon triangulifer]|uniref:zinc finger and BTB domain-containing protein 14-like n=1 Tax=Neocloeon triangulifer TaxID=2078957 RepID=UPI00286F1657|nr:zinc finger and BTB domain-containing protein 14-like [Neocloeon triangulifer]
MDNEEIETYSLKWNNYVEQFMTSFDSLRTEKALLDVTLSSEGRKLSAHKIILSASSPLLKQLLEESPNEHPLVIFPSIAFEDLEGIVDFIYTGKVKLDGNRLSTFLQTAELLEIKGLAKIRDDLPDVAGSLKSGKITSEPKLVEEVATSSYEKIAPMDMEEASDCLTTLEEPESIVIEIPLDVPEPEVPIHNNPALMEPITNGSDSVPVMAVMNPDENKQVPKEQGQKKDIGEIRIDVASDVEEIIVLDDDSDDDDGEDCTQIATQQGTKSPSKEACSKDIGRRNRKEICWKGSSSEPRRKIAKKPEKLAVVVRGRKYYCSLCQDKSFADFRSCKTHCDKHFFTTHTCHVCFKVYSSRKNYLRHSKIHTDQFKCQICEQKFACISHLKRHHESKHL